MTLTKSSVSLFVDKALVQAVKSALLFVPARLRVNLVIGAIKLTVEPSWVTLETTDLDAHFRVRVEQPGLYAQDSFSVMITAHAVKGLKPGARFSVLPDEYTVGGATYTPEFDARDFPGLPPVPDGETADLLATYFTDLADCAQSAQPINVVSRRMLASVYHHDGKLFATDSYKACEIRSAIGSLEGAKVLAAAAPALKKLFGQAGAAAECDFHRVRYHDETRELSLRTVEGPYPDFSRSLWTDRLPSTGTIPDVSPWIVACEEVVRMHSAAPKKEQDRLWSILLSIREDEAILSLTYRGLRFASGPLPFAATRRGMEPVSGAFNARNLKTALAQVGDGAVLTLHSRRGRTPQFYLSSDTRTTLVMGITPVADAQ